MRIGITGGIGSGKSYVCKHLAQRGIEVYDCDQAAKRLIRTETSIREALTALIGKDAYTADGDLNKAVVAQFLLASEDHRHAINAIVHPAVFNDFLASGIEWVESAILFECGLDRLTDVNIVVTAPEEVRIQRVMQRDHISREQAQAWIGRQWPQQRLQELADYEIVNDGQADINEQINNIIQLCKKPF